MECNKEEAVRAKGIAEKKMEDKDFVGARKIALKAQQLYPELENISQLIMVCDVHCSAEKKIFGTHMDWYGILKVEQTADEALIKKQFRKFALLLHPDKNKFAGAADAFKLIGEAQRVLLDHERRRMHDSQCKSAIPNGIPKQPGRPSNVRKPPGPEINTMNHNKQFQQPQQTTQTKFHVNRPTFWTACPFCSIRYQYYRDVLNKLLECQTCGKSFTGYEVTAQGTTPGTSWNQSVFPNQKGACKQGPSKMGQQINFENSTTNVGIKLNVGSGNTRPSYSKAGSTPGVGQGSKLNGQCFDVNTSRNKKRESDKAQPYGRMNGKKRKQISESSESCDSESSLESEEDVSMKGDGSSSESEEDVSIKGDGFYTDQFPRRSSRSKRNVSYNENINDKNDVMEPSEGAKCSESQPTEKPDEGSVPKKETLGMNEPAVLGVHMEENEKETKQKECSSNEFGLQIEERETRKTTVRENTAEDAGKTTVKEESIEDAATGPVIFEYPDPEFSDFDKDRDWKYFAVGQIWAIYDTLDAMPRFYAQIKKIIDPKFKLRITWLEPDPDDKDEIRWVEEDLPVSCGKFRFGSSENTEDHPMFSHLVSWEKGREKYTYKIYPRKGETWALFKDWNINWSSDPGNKRNYEYDFVEVLSDFADGVSVHVAYLGKVKGFSCLFCRTEWEGVDSVEISPKEFFRFSHRVPSFQLTGKEREDIPRGSFELDPACLPNNLQEIDPPVCKEVEAERMHITGSHSRLSSDFVEPVPKFHVDLSKKNAEQKRHSDSHVDVATNLEDPEYHSNSNLDNKDANAGVPASPGEAFEIPDTEFYNFDVNKSLDKFEMGQIWALYSDEDGLPKYYAKIKKVDHHPQTKLHVAWLTNGSTVKDMIQWTDKKMPVGCGRFKLKKGKQNQYTNAASFSHQVRAESTDKKDEYGIFPRKGEVWGLYKNWNAGIKCSDLENWDYDMVEVLEENDSGITVLVLQLVDGFNSVFKAQMNGQSTVTITIPPIQLLRFSHQIPAFRLTEERDGSLRGCLELDPAALPFHWFCQS